MKVIGYEAARSCTFRTQLRSGVWSVTKDDAFYGDYLSRREAVKGACAGARAVEALGGSAKVLDAATDTVIPHHAPRYLS